MKKWLFIFGIAILLSIAVFLYFKKITPQTQSPNVLSETEVATVTPEWKQSIVIDIDKTPIRVSWAIVEPEKTKLYSNLREQKLSEEIWVDKNCQILVNGGFYSKNDTHLGLFVTNFETITPEIESPLLDGFLWIKSNNASIGNNAPEDKPRIAVQTGPLLMQNSKPLILKINNDEPERRIVAGTTPDNKLIFLAVYRDGSIYQGPLLGKLPEIINLFNIKTGTEIINAINLDGGSHSIFISSYDRLNELTRVGSYFCAK